MRLKIKNGHLELPARIQFTGVLYLYFIIIHFVRFISTHIISESYTGLLLQKT